jgi:hypothetical protein
MLSLKSMHQFVLTGLTSILFLGNASAATVAISPDRGIKDTLAIIYGSELPHNDKVDISWASMSFSTQVAESVPTDENGNFTVTIVAPKDAPINESASILVFKKDGPILGGTSFTVTDKEPKEGCYDAYFIGLHGTGEGPDGPNQVLSRVIGETWDHFYSLAQLDGKNVRGYVIDYPAADWQVVLASDSIVRRGEKKLNKLVRETVLKKWSVSHQIYLDLR